MPRYIDADALYEEVGALELYGTDERNRLVAWHPNQNSIPYVLITDVLNAVNNQPTADVAERKKGEWFINESYIKCSECEDMWSNDDKEMIKSFNFCPNCGARMEVDE